MKNLLLLALALAAATAHAQADRLGLSLLPGPGGTLVVAGASGSAAHAGILPGDVLVAVDDVPLIGAKTLRPHEAVSGSVALKIRRGDDTFYVPVVLP